MGKLSEDTQKPRRDIVSAEPTERTVRDFDLIVIGAGPAGASAALHAGSLGARVALIDRERTGGTCTNTGCVPTRVLAITARLLRDIRGAHAYGIEVSQPQLDWKRTVARVNEVIGEVNANKNLIPKLQRLGGQIFLGGQASFVSSHRIRLASGREISGDKYILAIGGQARRPPIPGVEHAITPEELFSLEALPKRVAIIGSGYTGVQVTTILNAFGTQVTLLEMAATILPLADVDVSLALAERFATQGIQIQTGLEAVSKIERKPTAVNENGLELTYLKAGREQTLECDAVILCVGWPAALEGLGAHTIGLETERGFIKINGQLQTNLAHIFVAGDAQGRDMLVQAADVQGRLAAENALAVQPEAMQDYRHELLPSGGFTDPDHAGVGLTEAQARTQGLDILIGLERYEHLDRAIIDHRPVGFMKLIADRESGRVIGAHATGENAVELIQGLAMAMAAGVNVQTLAGVRLAYPTYSAIIGQAAQQMLTAIKTK
jgi:pyruvate/2-oxoglutarate dehydrogenase complex dihydrolipoamide dehydrogenase (E3) component